MLTGPPPKIHGTRDILIGFITTALCADGTATAAEPAPQLLQSAS